MNKATGKIDIREVQRDQLSAYVASLGMPDFRSRQVLHWVHQQQVSSWDEMTNLPGVLRDKLASQFTLVPIQMTRQQGSTDTTIKFLWTLSDGALVESVWIPANPALYGEASDRRTLCVSTQVGCAYGCRFCASGLLGWKRNLTAAEIIEQIYAVERWFRKRETGVKKKAPSTKVNIRAIQNLVIMGMGEPLANYEALMQALEVLNAPWGGGIGARKITISTSGLAPQIRRLADEPRQYRLALSLHGSTDEVRDRIMPVNRKYPLKTLLEACDAYRKAQGRMITLEYILIQGVNDMISQVKPLADIAHRLRAKINLIPYNKVDGLDWSRPSVEVQESFLEQLLAMGVQATLRREKGHDIDAACGQLRLKTEVLDNSNSNYGGAPII